MRQGLLSPRPSHARQTSWQPTQLGGEPALPLLAMGEKRLSPLGAETLCPEHPSLQRKWPQGAGGGKRTGWFPKSSLPASPAVPDLFSHHNISEALRKIK